MKLNWANRITILRILLIVPFVSCMLKINDPGLDESAELLRWLLTGFLNINPGEPGEAMRHAMRYVAIVIFFVMAASDAIDGCLARRKKMTTKLGAFLDPVADKLLITSACLLLASQRGHVEMVSQQGLIQSFLLPPTVVVLIIGKDLFLLIGFLIVYFITSKVHIAPVFVGKAATILQLSMVAGILIAPEASGIFPCWIWFLRVLWWSAAGTAILATLIYIRNGSRYIEEHEQGLANNNQR